MSALAPEDGGRALAGRPDRFQPGSRCRIRAPAECPDQGGPACHQLARFIEVPATNSGHEHLRDFLEFPNIHMQLTTLAAAGSVLTAESSQVQALNARAQHLLLRRELSQQ